MKKVRDLLKMTDLDIDKLENLPFQCQIYYTSLEGNKCVRVLSQQDSISHDRKELEREADVDLLGMNAV